MPNAESRTNGQEVIDVIIHHPVFKHPFWKNFRTASKNMSFEALVAMFYQFDQTTLVSRIPGNLPATLRNNGLTEQAEFIEQVLKSEQGHRDTLWGMMEFLLRSGFPKESSARQTDAAHRSEFGDMLHDVTKEYFVKQGINHGEPELPGTKETKALFALRDEKTYEQALYSLGVMAAVEFYANRSFMPGNIVGFIGNETFGSPTLKQPELAYLMEHVGDEGAEIEHERKMTQALLRSNLDANAIELIKKGAIAWCDAAGRWYDDMASLYQ